MLYRIICFVIFIFIFIKAIKSERKIMQGKDAESDHGFVVYLLSAAESKREYFRWMCGGAIVSPWYVVTSAACVEDLDYMYVISGYRLNVRDPLLVINDRCVKNYMKKIVYTCVPKVYDFDYAKIEKWSYIDIALVKVDSAFNFHDQKYRASCHYLPKPIEINYDPKYQEPDTDALVLGWGHVDIWRKPEEQPPKDYNQETLQYTSVLIHDKHECKKYFAQIPGLDNVIDKYMICTLEAGNIDEKGEQILKPKPLADGCTPVQTLLSNGEIECEEDEVIIDETRKKTSMISRILNRQKNQSTRRQGICQNDHGGPLITWVGSHQVLIGVASVFRVTEDSKCTGPFLYTSTQCNGAFLDCVLNSNNHTRRAICDKPPSERGFDIVRRTISWRNHPDGPAENEKILMRPVQPLSEFH